MTCVFRQRKAVNDTVQMIFITGFTRLYGAEAWEIRACLQIFKKAPETSWIFVKNRKKDGKS